MFCVTNPSATISGHLYKGINIFEGNIALNTTKEKTHASSRPILLWKVRCEVSNHPPPHIVQKDHAKRRSNREDYSWWVTGRITAFPEKRNWYFTLELFFWWLRTICLITNTMGATAGGAVTPWDSNRGE